MSMEEQQDITDRISSFNCKLILLEKTHELEEEERARASRNSAKRANKANAIRQRNESLSYDLHYDKLFSREEAERTELVTKMKESAKDIGLTPITDVLENFDGNLIQLKYYQIKHPNPF